MTRAGEASQQTSRLLIYDWRQVELVDYGTVVSLVGWRTNVQGFMVVQGQAQDMWKLAIVRPSERVSEGER